MSEINDVPEFRVMADLFKDFFEPIGRLIVAFAQMEDTLIRVIGQLMRLSDEDAYSVAATLNSTDALITLFRVSYKLHTRDKSLRSEARELAKSLAAANSFRNRVVHDRWGVLGITPGADISTLMAQKTRHTVYGEYKYSVISVTIGKILEETITMVRITHHLTYWLGRHKSALAQPAA